MQVEAKPGICKDPSDRNALYVASCSCTNGSPAQIRSSDGGGRSPVCPDGQNFAVCVCPPSTTSVSGGCVAGATGRLMKKVCSCNGNEI